MLDRKSFFNNILKTKNFNKINKAFKLLKSDIKSFKIPFLQSFEKNYDFDFDNKIIRKFSKYENIVIIGMGGSILGTKAIYNFFKNSINKKIFFFDNLDKELQINYKKNINPKKTCFIIISKSGNTLETLINLNLVFSKNLLKNKLVIISEIKNSSLMNIADKYNAEVIEYKNFIGGRYSVMSEASMFPTALMNLDINKFKNLNGLLNQKSFVSALLNNVSSINTLNQKGFKNSIILNYDSGLENLSLWYQQLVGESLGKKGKGIMPTISTCPRDHHSLLQLYLDGPKDKFFTFLSRAPKKNDKLQSIINAQCQATVNIFKKKKIPFRHFIFKKNNENELGSIFTFFVLETILLAKLMNVNPYNQPAVEQIKTETKKILLK
tara:strand:+ start:1390 stop:2532 length:1143 start_codon:yes stop_codon:yes gene_type:complete